MHKFIGGGARYTDVTVRYVPRFGGHSSMWFCLVCFQIFYVFESIVHPKILIVINYSL